jgi:hypothetical protein
VLGQNHIKAQPQLPPPTPVGQLPPPGQFSTGGVVTRKPTLKEFLKDGNPEVQHFADGGVVKGYAKGGVVTKTVGTGHRDDPVKVAHHSDAAKAGTLVADASPAQKEAGNYQKGHIAWSGFTIAIETPKGGTRKAKDGAWEVKDFPAHYGYIKRTKGADDDHVDIFFGDHPDSKRVWIIDQIDPATRRFDEHKCMLACATPKEARDLYASAFSNGTGPQRIGAFTMMSIDQFKNWVKRGKRTKPIGRLAPPRSGASRDARSSSPAPNRPAAETAGA